MSKNTILDLKKRINSEESSEFNSLFIINNDLHDFLDYDQETQAKQDPPISHSIIINTEDTKPKIKQEIYSSSPDFYEKSHILISPKKITLKKHNNFLIENKLITNHTPSSYRDDENGNIKTIKANKEKSPETKSERYKFMDSNDLLKSLKKKIQEKQKTSNGFSYDNMIEKTPKSKNDVKCLLDKESSEKTQEETNIEKNLKDSQTVCNSESPKDKDDKLLIENTDRNEIDGLDVYFETHKQVLAKIKLPINNSFLSKKSENEVLWTNGFEVETEDLNTFLIIKITVEKEVKIPFELNVCNGTEGIKTKMKHDWQFANVITNDIFDGVMLEGLDKRYDSTQNILMLNYEKLTMLELYDNLYKILMLYTLSTQSDKKKTLISISDIYFTEHIDFLNNGKKYILWVIFEPFDLQMKQIMELRTTKNMHYTAQELISIYRDFVTDLITLNESIGLIYDFSENNIFFSSAENCLKIIDLSFLFQIKNKIPHALTSLNGLIQRLKGITDFNENYKIQNFLKNLHTNIDKSLGELIAFTSPLKINNDCIVEKYGNEIKNKDRIEEDELLQHAKVLKKCYCYKLSNENYKKLLVKYEMEKKEDIGIKYKIGINFFFQGFFDKTKGILTYVKEQMIKNTDKHALEINFEKIFTISLIFAFIHFKENDLDNGFKSLEELLNLLKKNDKFGPLVKKNIFKYMGFMNNNLANNLSHLKKAVKIYIDALNINHPSLQNNNNNEEIINSLGILNAKLGNYDQSLNYFKQIYNDQNNATTCCSKDQTTIEKKITLLSNMSLVYMETKNYPEAKKLLNEASELVSQNQINEILRIKLLMHSGVLHDKMNEFYEALNDFKTSLHIFNQNFVKTKDLSHDIKRLMFGNLSNIAGIYLKFGDYEKSRKYLEKCEKLLIAFDSTKEKITAGHLAHNQGVLHKALSKIDEAVKYVENSLKIKRKYFEENNYNISNTMKLLFKLHLMNNNKEKALEYSEKVIEILKKISAKNQKDHFTVLVEIGETFEIYNWHHEATEVYNEACAFINNEQITDSKRIEFYNKFSTLYDNIKNWEKALEINEKLVEIYNKNRDENFKVLIDLHIKMLENCKKIKKDELFKKFQLELESLKVIQNNNNLLKKVGGKLLVSLKGVKAQANGTKKIFPIPNK